ncbi:hypothetical protein MRX96_049850 [Rhipicephalus microplus]
MRASILIGKDKYTASCPDDNVMACPGLFERDGFGSVGKTQVIAIREWAQGERNGQPCVTDRKVMGYGSGTWHAAVVE